MGQKGDCINVTMSSAELTTVTFELASNYEDQIYQYQLLEFFHQPLLLQQLENMIDSYNKTAAGDDQLNQFFELKKSQELVLKDGPNTEELILKDASANSDASTIDNVDIPTEEFQFLSGLDSDNLMKFSQQSAMQELLNKENIDIDIKPNLDIFPTLDEHDTGGYKFHLVIQPQQIGKLNWMYSELLNKVYIRMNDTLTFDIAYTPKIPFIQLRLRVLLCFAKDTSEPVLRCQNHISEDSDTDPQKLRSPLRCENPRTEYLGSDTGRSINERYCILVPLSMGVKPLPDKSVRQSIALKFTCQNSCYRGSSTRGTSLVIILESMSGVIFSQRNIHVKVCSCPKRDRVNDEKKIKRVSNDDLCTRPAKMVKQEPITILKQEPETSVLDELLSSQLEFERQPNGRFRMVLETNSRAIMQSALRDIKREVESLLYNEGSSKKLKDKQTEFYKSLYCASEEVKKL